MRVNSVRLINFRNYGSLHIKLNNKLNIFLGNNAQGKTNLLESIYICSSGKSFRTNTDKEFININKEEAYIGIEVIKNGRKITIELKFERGKNKRIRINKIETNKISEILGVLNVVIFSPEDLKIIKDSPSERRNFLNNEICQLKPVYRYNLSKYNKILYQRNNLLKIIQRDSSKIKLLEVFNKQLSEVGTNLIINRIKFIKKMSYISKNIHSKITGGLEDLKLEYISSFEFKSKTKEIISLYNKNNDSNISNDIDILLKKSVSENFEYILNNNIEKEIEKGTTQYGPHRDDISILINNMNTRIFGSQGQQRTAALSMKLAEIELIKNEKGEYPVLLLDDVLSELDINRRKYLISTFKNIQTIITSTDDIDIKNVKPFEKSIYNIKNGKIENLNIN